MSFETEESDDAEFPCETCGAMLPAFLESCPYCGDDPEERQEPCPSCGAMIADDAQQCPRCGDYVVMDSGLEKRAEHEKKSNRRIAAILILVFIGPVIWGIVELVRALGDS